jgi:TonB-linked SusC/RagA family outer membrane protein
MKNNLLTLLLTCFLTGGLNAQVQVTGKVTDEAGAPLPGVNVVVSGTNTGDFTEIDGSYSLPVPQGARLKFSMVGFNTFEATVPPDGKLDVVLREGVQLEQVVVTALGIERDKDALPYAHGELNAEPLTLARETNLGDALTGLVPGVNVSNVGSGPGGSTRIIIRGYHSVSRDNQPLFVVDGIPIDNRTLGSASLWGGQDWGDGLSSLNPDDIEKITVLKGNAAAALYGSRASNGVILITTKRGAARKGIGVEVNSNFTLDQPLTHFDFQQQYGQGWGPWKPGSQDDAFSSNWFNWGPKLDGEPVVQFDGVVRPYAAVKDNFRNFYQNGTTFNNSVALTAGNEQLNWRFGFSHLDNDFIVPNTTFNRKTFTLAGGGEVLKNLTAELTARYIVEEAANRPRMSDSPGNPNFAIAVLPPNVPVEALKGPNGDGSKADGSELGMNVNPWITNPYWASSRFRTDDSKHRIIGSVHLRYDLGWLYLQGRIGTDHYNSRRTDLTPPGTVFNPDGGMNEQTLEANETNADFLVGSRHDFPAGFGFDAFVGVNRMQSTYENIGLGGNKFNIAGLETVQNTVNQYNWYGLWRRRVNSVFGSATLHWKHRLYLTFTGRNDWFSTLPSNANNLFYPSVGASFVFSELFQLPAFINYGKVFASWAEVSGDVDPYSLDLTYQLSGQGFQGQPLGVITNNTIPDRALAPSTSREVEVGFDVKFLRSRLGMELSLYNRQTENDIIVSTISNASGFESAYIKEGEIENKGIEGVVSVVPWRSRNWEWNLTFNAARNWNEVTNLGKDVESIQIDASRTFTAYIHHDVGQPASVIKGFAYKRDDAGNIVFGANGLPLQGDYVMLGNGVHDFTGGINNTFRWRNLSLGVLIDFKTGGEIYSATNAYAYVYGQHKNTLEGRVDGLTGKGVTETGEPNAVHIGYDNLLSYYSHIFSNIAEEFVYDADFVKLRQVILTFELPKKWLGNSPIAGISVSAVGRNLALLYSKVPNVDPESTYNNTNAQGLEMFGVPQTRSFGFNLGIKF